MPEASMRQDVPSLVLSAIGRAKPDAESARQRITKVLAGLQSGPAVPPMELEKIINQGLIADWRIVAGYETLVAIAEATYFRPDQLAGCLSDARREISDRARAVFMMRDQWKGGGYPKTGVELVRCLTIYLEPFYRAGGAEQILVAITGENLSEEEA